MALERILDFVFPIDPESIITKSLPHDKLEAILNSEGNAFNVLNQGFRDLLVKEGQIYDLKFPHTTMLHPLMKVRVARASFLLDTGSIKSRFLIVETDSYRTPIEMGLHDPMRGNISIWPLTKRNVEKYKPPSLSGKDVGPNNLTPIILLSRTIQGDTVRDSGYAYLPHGLSSGETVYEGERIREILRNWVGALLKK